MPDIRHATIPIHQLRAHPRNYRKHPDQQLERLASSLARFSQYRSIVVQTQIDGTYRIVAGHGLVEAARQQGISELRADILPSSMSDDDIIGILVADNETSHLAEDDGVALAQLLQEQADAGYDLAALGSSDEELAALLESLGDDVLADSRTTELNEPAGGELESSLSVIVTCADESEQQRAYDLLTEKGFACRLVTL